MPGAELFGAEERKEINDVLETGILFRYNHEAQRQGIWKAREFEAELASYTGAQHAHVVSSGSAAVVTALAACGIGYGDEVIVPPFTYIATIEAVLLQGAVPVFAEIDDSLCLDPALLHQALSPRTRAVLLVHMCGAPARMAEIVAFCEEHSLVLVEDAGQALGASYQGRMVGTFGLAGAYSFDFFKIATAGEGGGCVTNNTAVYDLMHQFSDHGHDHIGSNRGMEQHPIAGCNFRISELHAAVGLAQMRRVPHIRHTNRQHKAQLLAVLQQFPLVQLRDEVDPEGDSGTFLNFFLPSEEMASHTLATLARHGVDGLNYWYDNMYHFIRNWDHLQHLRTASVIPAQRFDFTPNYAEYNLPNSSALIARLISMGIRVSWTEAELAERCQRLHAALSEVFATQTA